jgi:chromosome segregation and condensation protein ScpB
MPDRNPSQRSAIQERDRTTQRATLALLLFAFPRPLTQERIAEEIGNPDAVEQALSELETVGLSWRDRRGVMPTMAARHFDWLGLP